MALMGPANGFTPTQANAYIGSRLGVTTVAPAIYRPSPVSTPQPLVPPTTPPSPLQSGFINPLPVSPISGSSIQTSITQPATTPTQAALPQPAGYQSPVPYVPTLATSIPNAGAPILFTPQPVNGYAPARANGFGVNGSTMFLGMSENVWLYILIGAAILLFLVGKK